MDVGCNLCFFCGYAKFQRAAQVDGVDKNPSFIAQARKFFPQCRFQCCDWMSLGEKKYDVILFLSALHYADDQKKTLDFLMRRLNPRGLLVLELGVASGDTSTFVSVQRSIDTRLFPTQAKVREMLDDYAYKIIGPSARQAGDPLPRYVYHVSKKLPLAVLLLDQHYAGKTSTIRALFKENLRVLSGDSIIYRLCREMRDQRLIPFIEQVKDGGRINSALFVQLLCENNLLPVLLEKLLQKAEGSDCVIDMFVPSTHHEIVHDFFDERNFFVVNLTLESSRRRPRSQERVSRSVIERYFDYLKKDYLINEEAYLLANPDVAQAVSEGTFPSGQYHYWNFGRFEHRPLTKD